MDGSDLFSLRTLERSADRLGLTVQNSKHDYKSIVLVPKDDELPLFSRDTEFGYNGTVEGCAGFIAGWEKALMYMQALKLADRKKIKHKEDLYRQDRTLRALKTGKNDE